MSMQELMDVGGVLDWNVEYNKEPGYVWLKRFAHYYPYSVWLNPVPEHLWGKAPSYASIEIVGDIFPMFPLSPEGIGRAVKKLRVR
jgi:uncharacterized protein with von Willebrand factor type A (vWA) domain